MATPKKRTNVTLRTDLLEKAREFGVNVSSASEKGLEAEVRRAQAEVWTRENAQALAEHREWVAREGLPLAKYAAGPLGRLARGERED